MDMELYALLHMDRNLSCNLRQLRLDHHMTVADMAQVLDLRPEEVAAMERGRFPERLRLSHLDRITRRFPSITFADLLLTPPEGW